MATVHKTRHAKPLATGDLLVRKVAAQPDEPEHFRVGVQSNEGRADNWTFTRLHMSRSEAERLRDLLTDMLA